MFAYVDETGNTGKNIFDLDQPDFFTGALITKTNRRATWQTTPINCHARGGSSSACIRGRDEANRERCG